MSDNKVEINADQVRTAERERVSAISKLANKHNIAEDGNEFIDQGRSVDEFNAHIVANLDSIVEKSATRAADFAGISVQKNSSMRTKH